MFGALAALAGLEIRDTARRHVRVGVLVLVAMAFIIGAVAYALSALATVLAEKYGAVTADLMVGGGLLVVALLVGLAAWLVHRQPRSKEAKAALAMAAAPIALGLGRSLAPSLLKTAPLILIAGLIAGRMLSSRE